MNYDVIVIGGGPGGYVAAIRAAQLGMRTALVERAELGGICLNWGCIPTKALLKSAQVFDYLKNAALYGVQSKEEPVASLPEMVKRSRDVAGKMMNGVKYLMRKNKVDVIQGHGRIKPGRKVVVTDVGGAEKEYGAGHIILATGARSRELPTLKQDGMRIIGYREAMTLSSLPKRMVIVGSGAIGVEFAYLYATLGTDVTLVETLPQIMPLEDEEVSLQLAQSLAKSGVTIKTSTGVEAVHVRPEGCIVSLRSPEGVKTVECDVVLSSVGIAANIENLGLDQVGVRVEQGRIVVNEAYETNVEGYYAIGDCIPTAALAHVASAEAIRCIEGIAGLKPHPIDYGNVPGCTYTQPEVASVGYTEKAAREAGLDIKVGKFPFSASGKAKASGHSDGFVKIILDSKHDTILGAHMVGANVTEMIAEIVVARKLETTAEEILASVHPHPTMSEAVMEAVAAACGEAIHL
jgi:dihydrolipoamide dehydrogenase